MSSVFVINVTVMTFYVTLIIMSTNGVYSKMCQMNEGPALHRIISTHACECATIQCNALKPCCMY